MTTALRRALVACALVSCAVVRAPCACAGETLFIQAGTVVPIVGEPIPDGRIVVRDGVVTDVGKDVVRPAFSRLVDASGRTITPGFVLAASRIGLPSGGDAETTQGAVRVDLTLDVKAVDELNPRRPEYAFLLQQGITTLGLMPSGTAAGVPGLASATTLRPDLPKVSVLAAEAAVVVNVATHAEFRRRIGEAFRKQAEPARRDAHASEKKSGDAAESKPASPMTRVLAKKLPVLVILRTPAGWLAARDVLPLERLDVTIFDDRDLYPLAAEMHDAGARVLTWPALARVRLTRQPVNRAAEYEAAGVPYGFLLPYDVPEAAADLRDAAIEMARTGCKRTGVLAALTLVPAQALGVADRVGSIQRHRRADLLFWSGDPLDPLTTLDDVMVGGIIVPHVIEAPGPAP